MMTKRLLYIGNKLSKHGKTPTALENLGPVLEKAGFTVHYSSSQLNKPLRFLSMVFSTIYRAKTVDYVLIDTYSTSNYWYAFAVSQICRLFSVKYIPILHGGNLPRRIKSSPEVSKMIFENAHAIVAPSRYLANAFAEFGFQNIYIIENPIAVDDFKFKERQRFDPKLIWVRSFANIYNPILAIEIFHQITRKYPAATLTMVGPDSENMMSKLKDFSTSLDLEVNFTGKLTKKELIATANGCDIFLNTTNVDNTPASMIEAAALGLAIVSTNVGGIPYLFENSINALLVEPNNKIAMFEAIINCCEFPDQTTERVRNAFELTKTFSAPAVLEKWQKLLV